MIIFRKNTVIIFVLLAAITVFAACSNDGDNDKADPGGGSGPSAGDKETFSAEGVSFVMGYVPGGHTFPIETDDSGTATVSNSYRVGETEVTYELWTKVRDWAADGSVDHDGDGLTFNSDGDNDVYAFENPGRMGSDAGGTGMTDQHPVTMISWRDAIVWCNAMTEWINAKNGTAYECVYTYSGAVIRDSQDSNGTACDNTVVSPTAEGFRLPTMDEWELAARWRSDSTNTVNGYSSPWFTKGNSASGATTDYHDDSNGSGEPAKTANDLVAVYGFYYEDGVPWSPTGITGTAEVKSKAGGANSLGLYDMSGNVDEFCFDLHVTNRVLRGGKWNGISFYLQVGVWGSTFSDLPLDVYGFRVARTVH